MNREIDHLLENPYLGAAANFSVAALSLLMFLWLFETVTRYRAWSEILRGNWAAALAVGGKIFGICNLFRFSILNHDNVYQSFAWAGFGFILLLAAYFVFEFLTPWFNVDREIQRGNAAVGFLSFTISAALSYVIGAGMPAP